MKTKIVIEKSSLGMWSGRVLAPNGFVSPTIRDTDRTTLLEDLVRAAGFDLEYIIDGKSVK